MVMPCLHAGQEGGTGLWSSEASPPVGTGAVADTATHTRWWCAPHVTPGALAMAIGLTAHGWTTHAWRSSRVSAACLDQEREHQPPCPRWDACHDERCSPRHHFIYTSAESRRLCWVGL